MPSPFKTFVPGKYVLTGEHAVLRREMAIALPHPEYGLTLEFFPDPSLPGLEIEPAEAREPVAALLARVAADEHHGEPFSAWDRRGRLLIRSTIPSGAGLGSSAALCVALAWWMSGPLFVPEDDLFAFATGLEDHFHGKSSGMDVAVTSSREPIVFVSGRGARGIRPLGLAQLPVITFHDTGLRMTTREAVARVHRLRESDHEAGTNIDLYMGGASRLAMEGLLRYSAGDFVSGLKHLELGMTQAHECFEAWDLVPVEVRAMRERLLAEGARAVKLTGAGGGGFLVALRG